MTEQAYVKIQVDISSFVCAMRSMGVSMRQVFHNNRILHIRRNPALDPDEDYLLLDNLRSYPAVLDAIAEI